MASVVPEGSVIELDVAGVEQPSGGGRRLPTHVVRTPLVALVVLCCLVALVASALGRPSLGEPVWAGRVSLNGFALGPHNVYVWRLDGRAVIALDAETGRPRWSHDITNVPQSIEDLGNGVVVVMTRSLPPDGGPEQPSTITMLRDTTGALIAQTTGASAQASADGRRLLVFSSRIRDVEGCTDWAFSCPDITAWNLDTGKVAWRVSLPPNTTSIPSTVDGRVDGLAEIDADGTVRLRDVSSGAVAVSASLPAELTLPVEQAALFPKVLVTVQRDPRGIELRAFERPTLRSSWSVVVPEYSTVDPQTFVGGLYLWQCGRDACLTVNGISNRVIDQSTGAVTPPVPLQIVQGLGADVFLATPLSRDPSARTDAQVTGLVVDSTGRTLATIPVNRLLDWTESGDRALVTQEGTGGTGIVMIDSRGNVDFLGAVSGISLNCQARADQLACSDPSGTLRVWHLPSGWSGGGGLQESVGHD